MLQNVVNTYGWLTANFQLLGPIISLGVETKLFVQPLYKTKLFFPLAIFFTLLSSLVILLGPAHHANIFHLYVFPQHFRSAFPCMAHWIAVATPAQ